MDFGCPFAFFLGFLHGLEPDHLAVLGSYLAVYDANKWRGVGVGFGIAFGHLLATLAVGAVVLALGDSLSPRYFTLAEAAASILLIFFGGWILSQVFFRLGKAGVHTHPNGPHIHLAGKLEHSCHIWDRKMTFWGIGFGLAPPLEAVAVFLLMAKSHRIGTGLAYLGFFSFGLFCSMGMAAFSIESVLKFLTGRRLRIRKGFALATGAGALAIGLFSLWK